MTGRARADLPRDQDTAVLFLDESGSISNDRYFAVGCLKLKDPATVLRDMQAMRDKRQFYRELHFSAVTKGTLPVYREVVDILAGSGENFSCFVADRSTADPIERFGTSFAAYEKLAVQLVIGAVRPSEVVAVLADNYSTPAQFKFEHSVKRQVNRRLRRLAVLDVVRLDSRSADPLQLVDLLTSAVAFEYRQSAGIGSATSPKGILAKYVRDRFGVQTWMGGCLSQSVSVKEYEHDRWLRRTARLSRRGS